MTAPLDHLTFHHMALAVKTDREALVMLEALGFTIGQRIHDPVQNVYVRLCTSPSRPPVEIVQPGGGDKGPVDAILSKYREVIYHTCYETPDLQATLAAFDGLGLSYMTLSDWRPACNTLRRPPRFLLLDCRVGDCGVARKQLASREYGSRRPYWSVLSRM